MRTFGRTNKSKKVSAECAICNKQIQYLLFPQNSEKHSECFRFADINPVKVCNNCGCLIHSRCSSERKRRGIESEGHTTQPTLGGAS